MEKSTSNSLIIDQAFVKSIVSKDRVAIARAISIAEKGEGRATTLSNLIHPHIGQAFRIGITGPPGAGKSTLTAQLAKHVRQQNASVAIVAVDPSSPITSGAVLGDRVRMDEIENDEDVFIRSMATRGMSGGLSAKACDAADVLDAAGFDYIFIESVGIGQIEVKIEKFVDTTIVVLVPESGDQVQAIKAGLMEIADIYVLNKADREGSAKVLTGLQSALGIYQDQAWSPQLVPCVANSGEGTVELLEIIQRHREHLSMAGRLSESRTKGIKTRIHDMVNELVSAALWDEDKKKVINDMLPAVLSGEVSAKQVADMIADNFLSKKKSRD